MGKNHAGERAVRFSAQKAATKVGTDCQRVRATGEGRPQLAAILTCLQLRVASKAELEITRETTLDKTMLEIGGRAALENER